MSTIIALPTLIPVWPDFGKSCGLSRGQSYVAASHLPVGVRVTVGGRTWLNADKLASYLESGGDLGSR